MEHALEEDPSELKKEFVRLFFDPAGPPCPPFQSVNTSDELLGPTHRSALAWYRAAGMEPKATAEPADHVGLLLAFYARILEFETPDVLQAFREEHLTWVPAYCERVILEARHPFYRLLAGAARKLLG
jgi:TorA maturation chaperone TorD